MSSRISHLLLTLMLVGCKFGFGQCPAPSFLASDTVCPLQPLLLNNSLSTASTHSWDFCLGDLDSVPSCINAPSSPGTLAFPQNAKLVEENGEFHAFVVNATANYITRYDFGNSLNNVPVITNLTGSSLLSTFASGIDMVKANGKWYAFVVTFSGNNLLRVEFDSLKHLSPSVINLNVSGLFSPFTIKLIGGYAFIGCYQTPDLMRVDFNGDYTNTSVNSSSAANTGAFANYGIDIAYDCSTGKYIGYGTISGAGILYKLDFGNNLSNNATVSTVSTNITGGQGVLLVQEGNDWHVFAVGSNNVFHHFEAGSSLDNPLTLNYAGSLGNTLADPKNIQLVKSGSIWSGIIVNNAGQNLSILSFPQGCSTGIQSSTFASPTTITYPPGTNGYQTYELREIVNDTVFIYTDSVMVDILPPKAYFGFNNTCSGTPVEFFDSSEVCFGAISSWSWDFGDGNNSILQNPTHTYSSSGTYTVTLTCTSTGGQSNTLSIPLSITPPPSAGFTSNGSVCVGAPLSFIDNSSASNNIIDWQWQFGDNTIASGTQVVHQYQVPGIYPVTLVIETENGCLDSTVSNVNVLPGPFAGFTVNNTCAGDSVNFTNTSNSPGTSISGYSWDFGDNSSSNAINPSHFYGLTTGTFPVTLIAQSNNGCADTSIYNVTLSNKANPAFVLSKDSACTFENIFFSDFSSPAPGDTILRRIWDFGDGTTDTNSTTVSHSYTLPGAYTIRLTVFSPTDCDTIVSQTVYIIGSPTATFTATDACEGADNTFTDLSSSPLGTNITSWIWDFGDGQTSILENPLHLYADTGAYTVQLIVINSTGCSDTSLGTTTVRANPLSGFSVGKICTKDSILFIDSSTVYNGTIFTWSWSVTGTGQTSNNQNPHLYFPDPLAYQVSLVTTSTFGCRDTLIRTVVADASPAFSISSSNVCVGEIVQFQYIPSPGSAISASFLWLFGDSTASFTQNPSHLYADPGIYPITLEVSDNSNGCSGVIKDTVNIFSLPDAGFVSTNACSGQPFTLNDTSTINEGTITNWTWSLADTILTGIASLNYTINSSGNSSIELTVTSDKGCKDSISQNITIHPLPVINLQANPYFGAPPLNVAFSESSGLGNQQWDFGDNSSINTNLNPNHLYLQTGNYVATLLLTDSLGCRNRDSIEIFVVEPNRDIGLNNLTFTKINGFWEMSIGISNTGNEIAESFEIQANLNKVGTFINRFEQQNLFPGQQQQLVFNTKLPYNGNEPEFMCAEVIQLNDKADMNTGNNYSCKTISRDFDILNLYPNPTNDIIQMDLYLSEDNKVEIQLFDARGRLCIQQFYTAVQTGLQKISFSVANLEAGTYHLRASSGELTRNAVLLKE